MKDENKKPNTKSPEKKHKEQLSKKDIEELMNINMQVLVKKNGAWRRK